MPLSGRTLPTPTVLQPGGAQPSVLSISHRGERALGKANSTVSAMTKTLNALGSFRELQLESEKLEVEREKIDLRYEEGKNQLEVVSRSFKLKSAEIDKMAGLVEKEQLRQFAENALKRETDHDIAMIQSDGRIQEAKIQQATTKLTLTARNYELKTKLEYAKGEAHWIMVSGRGDFPPIETLRKSPFQTKDGLIKFNAALKDAETVPTATYGEQYQEDRIAYYGMLHEAQFTLGEGKNAESFTVAEVIDLLGDVPSDDPTTEAQTIAYQLAIRDKFHKLGWENIDIDSLQNIAVPEFSNVFNLKEATPETYRELAAFIKAQNTELQEVPSALRKTVMQEGIKAYLTRAVTRDRIFFPPDVLQKLYAGAEIEVPVPTRVRAGNATGKSLTFTEQVAGRTTASTLVNQASQTVPPAGQTTTTGTAPLVTVAAATPPLVGPAPAPAPAAAPPFQSPIRIGNFEIPAAQSRREMSEPVELGEEATPGDRRLAKKIQLARAGLLREDTIIDPTGGVTVYGTSTITSTIKRTPGETLKILGEFWRAMPFSSGFGDLQIEIGEILNRTLDPQELEPLSPIPSAGNASWEMSP